MTPGFATVRTTVWGFVFFGLSWMKLFFVSDDKSQDDIVVLAPGDRHVAYRCSRCNTLSVTSSPWTPSK
jgi:hypothetical protein